MQIMRIYADAANHRQKRNKSIEVIIRGIRTICSLALCT